ncbi:multicopper oxidase family protein [Azospirillum rugosum]|uniref:FtsP/CotA-like multicopper oxidase with cupredoxin domain n=1 Tax=Azospirillum rugosum TaxID=416170 RepID=A0ABS4SED2_9PROT|nr:multicopper oxidase domain-containing protein [Azospirillum rugosum]MBP2290934.1 FtsP/CotA-like multicopper oxidase with cupredoxin domain [Azospirillum rugosum]MDQ0525002.1 FtsP/CotA-like multicopper oxidase with cupredoxin domain [Azospirillum rugosum]
MPSFKLPIPHSRRQFLTTAASAAALGGLSALVPAAARRALAADAVAPTRLVVERRVLEVMGKPATVFGIRQPDGTSGLVLDAGQRFLVDLENQAGEDTVIHWHGMTPPYAQDGVADANRPLVAAGTVERYDFAPRPGTHWMHSHHGLQEQRLMAAPLVVRTAEDRRADVQEVAVLLHDFTFKDPAELLAGLTGGGAMAHGGHGGHEGHGMSMPGMDKPASPHGAHQGHGSAMPSSVMSGGTAMDLNDVEYDAYLANDRTLDDPQLVQVERGGRVRLRLINGATSTAFHIDLGALEGTVVAADGNPVKPVTGRRFGMVMGQRLDILVQLPPEGGAFPMLAQREGDRRRTGIILATPGAAVAKVAGDAAEAAGPVDLSLEQRLTAAEPLPARDPGARFRVRLTGSMMPYVWTIDDRPFGRHLPLAVSKGQRVVVEMVNASGMAHPMHLHGHHFQVVALNGAPVNGTLGGAVRDTVLVPLNGSVTVAFDADNPGRWPLHCHNLMHMATGMMTEVVYDRTA